MFASIILSYQIFEVTHVVQILITTYPEKINKYMNDQNYAKPNIYINPTCRHVFCTLREVIGCKVQTGVGRKHDTLHASHPYQIILFSTYSTYNNHNTTHYIQCVWYITFSTVCVVHYVQYSVCGTLRSVQCVRYITFSAVCVVHYVQYSVCGTLRSVLCVRYSTFGTVRHNSYLALTVSSSHL